MIPLRDVIPSRTTPVVGITLIALNTLVFLYEQTLTDRGLRQFIMAYGLVPAMFDWTAVISSMFLHGGWSHFLGNMLFLWIFGDNVEDRLGHGRFLFFYIASGIVAALVQTGFNPDSAIPMVGASGAISGVLGAYIIMFPHSRVLTLIWLFVFVEIVEIPAVFLLGLWFVLQLVSGLGSLSQPEAGGGVAFWAHAAGFVAGMALLPFLKRPERQRVEWWDKARSDQARSDQD